MQQLRVNGTNPINRREEIPQCHCSQQRSHPLAWLCESCLIRTERHHKEVYGFSLARLEFAGLANETLVQYVGLGLIKASHKFLMLHYFATDSAQIWDDLDATQDLVFSHAPARRAHAYEALLASHVAPSCRRMPHPLWSSCMTFILRLCWEVARSQLAFHLGVPHSKPTHHEPLSRTLAGEAPTSQCPAWLYWTLLPMNPTLQLKAPLVP